MTQFSDRLSALAPAGTVAFLKAAEARRQQGADIISLAAAEPFTRTADAVNAAAIDVIERRATQYAGAEGTAALKEALRQKFLHENNLDFSHEQILVANGSKPLMAAALLAFVNPSDEVVVPAPYYNAHIELTKLAGAVPIVPVASAENGFVLQAAQLAAAISPRTRAVFFSNPNNPSGAVYGAGEWRALGAVLEQHPKVWIIIDELFENLVHAPANMAALTAVLPSLAERTVIVNGFSKGYSMNGWRLGFAAGPVAAIRAISGVATHISGPPSPISQAGGLAALVNDGKPTKAEFSALLALRDESVAALNAIPGLHCQTPASTFLLFPSCQAVLGKTTAAGAVLGSDTDYAAALLAEAGVAVVPGSDFGVAGHFRLSFAPGREIVRRAIDRITSFHAALT